MKSLHPIRFNAYEPNIHPMVFDGPEEEVRQAFDTVLRDLQADDDRIEQLIDNVKRVPVLGSIGKFSETNHLK